MIAAEHGDDDPLESDIAFHIAILRASGNRFYAQLRGNDRARPCASASARPTGFKGVRLASVKDHEKVCNAIMAGEAAKAEIAGWRSLIQEALDLIRKAQATGAIKG